VEKRSTVLSKRRGGVREEVPRTNGRGGMFSSIILKGEEGPTLTEEKDPRRRGKQRYREATKICLLPVREGASGGGVEEEIREGRKEE